MEDAISQLQDLVKPRRKKKLQKCKTDLTIIGSDKRRGQKSFSGKKKSFLYFSNNTLNFVATFIAL